MDDKERIAKAAPNIERAVYNARILELQDDVKKKDESIKELSKKLRKLETVQEENALLSSELERIREETEKERKEHADTVEALKVEHMEKENALKDEMDNELREIRMNAMENAKKKLNQVSRELINDNAGMKEAFIEAQRKVREVTNENKELKEQLNILKRNADLYTQKEGEYAQEKYKNTVNV